jgi:hypothetical protein
VESETSTGSQDSQGMKTTALRRPVPVSGRDTTNRALNPRDVGTSRRSTRTCAVCAQFAGEAER